MQDARNKLGVIAYPPVFNVSKAETKRLLCRYLRCFTCKGLYITEGSSKSMVNLSNVLERWGLDISTNVDWVRFAGF
jgi:hypothetical protein